MQATRTLAQAMNDSRLHLGLETINFDRYSCLVCGDKITQRSWKIFSGEFFHDDCFHKHVHDEDDCYVCGNSFSISRV